MLSHCFFDFSVGVDLFLFLFFHQNLHVTLKSKSVKIVTHTFPARFWRNVYLALNFLAENKKGFFSLHQQLTCEVWKWLDKKWSLVHVHKVSQRAKVDLDLWSHEQKSIGFLTSSTTYIRSIKVIEHLKVIDPQNVAFIASTILHRQRAKVVLDLWPHNWNVECETVFWIVSMFSRHITKYDLDL